MADTVTMSETDDAFYDSYKDPQTGKLDSRLVDPKTGKRRPLTADPSDSEFRKEWSKIRKHLQEQKNCAPKTGGGKITAKTPCPGPKKPDNPPYEPTKWNDKGSIQGSTNCYAYAMNSRTGHPAGKPQPGDKSKTRSPNSTSTCSDVTQRVTKDGAPEKEGDLPSIEVAPQCRYQKKHKLPPPDRKGYYLVFLVTTSVQKWSYDPATKTYNVPDYHWYRQDDDGNWSGKPGNGEASDKDASGAVITNPETCNSDYTHKIVDPSTGLDTGAKQRINYDKPCGYFYVQKGGVKVGS